MLKIRDIFVAHERATNAPDARYTTTCVEPSMKDRMIDRFKDRMIDRFFVSS
jgi:hypothetical protein